MVIQSETIDSSSRYQSEIKMEEHLKIVFKTFRT